VSQLAFLEQRASSGPVAFLQNSGSSSLPLSWKAASSSKPLFHDINITIFCVVMKCSSVDSRLLSHIPWGTNDLVFRSSWNVSTSVLFQALLISNLANFFQFIYLFPFFTCFEQPSAHHQERRIVSIHHLVYVTLCRRLPGMPVLPDRHTRQSPTQSDIYQMMYRYNSPLLMMSTGLLETRKKGK